MAPARHPWWRRGLRFWLLAAAAAALGVALLRPELAVKRDVYSLLFVLDITQSMNVSDVLRGDARITRLAAAKEAIRQALTGLPCGSEAGIAIFTEYRSFLLLAPVEVCGSYAELSSTLQRLDWRMGWAGASEIAKGLHFAIGIAKGLEPRPALVFVTDGHEAPPVNMKMRQDFGDRPGEASGLIVGVGGSLPAPIPKFDMDGKALGTWGADEVAQVDVYSMGRPGSVQGESMVGSQDATKTGTEHLSALKEDYLRLLAADTGLAYLRLESPAGLLAALSTPAHAHARPVPTDLRWLAAAAALAALLAAASGFIRRT